MTTNNYQCTHCQHAFEMEQKISDEHIKHCPACQQQTLRVVIQLTAFRTKGQHVEKSGRA